MAAAAAAFRVGPEKNQYNYMRSKFEVNGKPVYRCTRSASGDDAFRLFLYCTMEGFWIAVEAKEETENPTKDNVPKFRTLRGDIEDISSPGRYEWQWWDPEKNAWDSNRVMEFITFDLRPQTDVSASAVVVKNDG